MAEGRRVHRTTTRLAACAVAAGACCATVGTAWAHDYLVASTPAAGTTITSQPGQIRLTFDDMVATRPTPALVHVTGPDGRYYETGCATTSGRDVSLPVRLGPAGRYTVRWRVVSADTHPVTADLTFGYRPAEAASGAGSAEPHTCAAVDLGAGHQPASGGGLSPALLVVGGIALVTAVALVRVARRSRW